MIRLPRFLPSIVLACATAMPVLPAFAQDAPKPADDKTMEKPAVPAPADKPADPKPADAKPADTTTPVPAPGDKPAPAPGDKPADAATTTPPAATVNPNDPLTKKIEDFWHYAKIARYDMAAETGKAIIAAGAPPEEVLADFLATTSDRHDDLNSWLLKWQQIDAMKETSTQLMAVLRQGQDKKRMDPAFIETQIKRLSLNERGYINGLVNLRQSGEVAIPMMVDYLRDTAKKEYHTAIRRALVDLGRAGLNPLLACTEMKLDQDTLITLVSVLGQIGYRDEIPYLARLANGKEIAPSVKAAASHALERMGAGIPEKLDVAALFYDLSEKFYYGSSAVSYDLKNPTAYVWFWEDTKGLYKEEVPPAIFNDVMAMRTAEYALKADSGKTQSVSLWLSADYKREVDLADGNDPINKGKPAAHFYGTSAGVQHLNKVLERARRDHNAPVSLRAVKSLEEIAGQANLYNGDVQPLVDAMSYPDRLVRFEAAIAAGSALPQKPFKGQEQVVPILAESIAQTGKASALVLSGDQDQFNKLVEQLKAAGYTANGGLTPEDAINKLTQMASVDVVVIDATSGVDEAAAKRFLDMATINNRLTQLAKVVIATTQRGNVYAVMTVSNPLINVTIAKEGAALAPVLQKARDRSGSLPLDEKTAQDYALRCANLLGKLAISRGQVLNLMDALPTLLGSLEDARPEIAKAGAGVLGLLDSPEPQPALLAKALDDKAADELKVAALKGLTTSERFFGGRLTPEQIESLTKLAGTAMSPDVKSAAAEALGALNLPSNEAKALIVNQARVN